MPTQDSPPIVNSLQDVTIAKLERDGQYVHHSFYYLDPVDDQVWLGTLSKSDDKDKIPIDDINQHLQPIEASKVYPKKPAPIKVSPSSGKDVWVKRPDFDSLEDLSPDWATSGILHEASIMELIPPHPNIVTYYGCRVFQGRITGIVLERLDETLTNTRFDDLDTPTILSELQSAVSHFHSLGLAHNDINPYNIMAKNGRPILIDFGACAVIGERIQYGGTPGWCEETIFFSKMQHDTYGMKKLREWLGNGADVEEDKTNLVS